MDPVDAARGAMQPQVGRPRRGASMADAARDFEALMLHRMLKSATKPIGKSGLLDGGSGGRLFRDLFLEEVARLATRKDGLGLAQAIGAQERPEDAKRETTEGSR